MANKGVGAVLILDGEKITGIFSERDYVRESAKVDGLSLTTPINNLMTHLVFYIQPDATVDECMALMTEKKFRHLPVVENEKLVGLISIGDVVKQYISQKDIHIRSLESYILGREYNQ
jgi:CBS domain-containing protein